jgi:steroid delta-isomerase-like uncharacterized protein
MTQEAAMDSGQMQGLVDTHMTAENHGDIDGAVVLEQLMTGTVIGSLLGLPGNGRSISFRMMHVFGFRDGLISRENIWLDTAAVADQLS